MSPRRRLVRIAITLLVIVLFTGYFLFSTLLFSPLEGRYEHDLATLIPREVDFYVSKDGLGDDFDASFRPAFAEELAGSRGGRAVMALPEYRELLEKLGVGAELERLRESLAGAPVEIDLLDVFGGKDLAVAGFLHEGGIAAADWTVYGRASWMGKLAVELLRYPDLLGLEERGLSVEEGAGVLALGGTALSRPLHVARIQDVVIVGTDAEMVARAALLETTRGENSFGQSAKHADYIALAREGKGELELFADNRALSRALGMPARWPDSSSAEFAPAYLGRLFQLGSVRDLIGTASFGTGLRLRLTATLSSELMSATQKRLYRTRGFDRARLIGDSQVASLAPADVGFFVYGHAELADLLNEALASAERDLVSNLEDLVRQVWGYSDLNPLVGDLAAAFRDRAAFFLRNNDYPDEGDDGPPHNTIPVPAWALVLEVADPERLEGVRARIHNNPGSFSIQGRDPGSHGIFVNTVEGGYRVYEYWSQLIDGTGHLATLEMEGYFILSNSHQLLGAIVKTFYEGGGGYPRLAQERWFQTQVAAGPASANVALWFNPRAIAETTRARARLRADEGAVIDWSIERPRIERRILAEHFPGQSLDSLSPAQEEELAVHYEREASEFERDFRAENAPQAWNRVRRRLEALEILRGVYAAVSLDPRQLELFLRLIVPFDRSAEEEAAGP